MSRIHENLEYAEFEMPASIERTSVCSQTGLLPRAGCPVTTEYFDVGSLPTEYCDQHFYVVQTPTPTPAVTQAPAITIYPTQDPGTGAYPTPDPGTGTYPTPDPGTGTYPTPDPGTGTYPDGSGDVYYDESTGMYIY